MKYNNADKTKLQIKDFRVNKKNIEKRIIPGLAQPISDYLRVQLKAV